jgi:uncharacterized protein (TIGR01777 family)
MKRIVIAGGTGFLGRALSAHFHGLDREVVILTRAPHHINSGPREIAWDGKTLGGWTEVLEDAETVINLAGRSVDCRYTKHNRDAILHSRIDSTRVLGQAIAACKSPPSVWLNSSTATIYCHSFDVAWDESGQIDTTAEANDEFSIEVALAWERELNGARTPRTRKVALRTAMVVGCARNSVFPVLRRLVRMGLGGKMGSGKQYVSWIHETDFCRAVEWLLGNGDISGPVNLCAPNPLPNAEMMRLLRRICGQRIGLPSSEWMIRAGAFFLRTEPELVLKSRRVVPGCLAGSGFDFLYPYFENAAADLNRKC